MRKTRSVALLLIILVLFSCSPLRRIEENDGVEKDLVVIEETNKFENLNGFKAEKGKFYFSGILEEKLGFFSLSLINGKLEKEDWDIGEFDLYVPLKNQESIIVNFDGQLIHRKEGKDKKIDEDISGEYSPNISLSPDKKLLLYTKGPREKAALYRYDIIKGDKKVIKEKISDEAFYTFHYTTLWSNTAGYFVYNNEEIYDDKGVLYGNISATTSKWSPKDDYIAYIQKPQELEAAEIQIGDWKSSIGEVFNIYELKSKESKALFSSGEGFIDPVDSIQWSKDGSRVAISEGKIIMTTGRELEEIQYKKVLVYDIENNKSYEVDDMKYNHYQFIFNNILYGNNFGVREPMEIINYEEDVRNSYDSPVMLNSKDIFVIDHGGRGYFVNGKSLMEIAPDGGVTTFLGLPWEIDEMYIDHDTEQLIIINDAMELYLLKL